MADDVDDERKIEVKTRLNAAEFVAMQAVMSMKGLNQSALIRMLIKDAIADHCAEQLPQAIGPERSQSGTGGIYPWPGTIGER